MGVGHRVFRGRGLVTKMSGLDMPILVIFSGKKAHKHKLFALVKVRMALGQTAGCPRVNRAQKFMCSPRNTGNINFSLWLTGGLSQGCPDFQKVYVFKVYVPFSCPNLVLLSRSCLYIQCFPLEDLRIRQPLTDH